MSVTQTFSRSNCQRENSALPQISWDFTTFLFFRVAIFAEISPCLEARR